MSVLWFVADRSGEGVVSGFRYRAWNLGHDPEEDIKELYRIIEGYTPREYEEPEDEEERYEYEEAEDDDD